MSFLTSNALRSVGRSSSRIRGYSTTSPGPGGYLAEHRALQHHANGSTSYLLVPLINILTLYTSGHRPLAKDKVCGFVMNSKKPHELSAV
jgi:hypothetical protein